MDTDCVVCNGKVVEDIVTEYDPPTGSMFIGPASKDRGHRVSKGFYCTSCGLKYQFHPKRKPLS